MNRSPTSARFSVRGATGTSALVNEAYLRLVDYKRMRWQNRAHFLAVSAQAMRRILVDRARRRNVKRGADAEHVPLDAAAVICPDRSSDFASLDDAVVREGLTEQWVVAGLYIVAAALSLQLACGQINRRNTEEVVGTIVCGEQRTDFARQLFVAAAGAPQKHVALHCGNVERGLQQLIDVVPAFVVHSRSGRPARDTARLWRSSTRA